MTIRTALYALIFALLTLVPALAQADLKIAGSGSRERKPLETEERQGLYLGMEVSPGAVLLPDGFTPTLRGVYHIGGAIRDRATLGAAIGVTGYLGHKKAAFDGDIIATGFIGRGFYLRGGLGVRSATPARDRRPFRPGLGGLVGLGYEFRVMKRLGLALGVDYDVRLRTDGIPVQTVGAGLRFIVYMNKKR